MVNFKNIKKEDMEMKQIQRMVSMFLMVCMIVTAIPATCFAAESTQKDFIFTLRNWEPFHEVRGAEGKVYVVRDGAIISEHEVRDTTFTYTFISQFDGKEYEGKDEVYAATLDTSKIQAGDKIFFDLTCDGFEGTCKETHGKDTIEEAIASDSNGKSLDFWLGTDDPKALSENYVIYVEQLSEDMGTYNTKEELYKAVAEKLKTRPRTNVSFHFSEKLIEEFKADGTIYYNEIYGCWMGDEYAAFDFYGDQMDIAPYGGDYWLNSWSHVIEMGCSDSGFGFNLYGIEYDTTPEQEAAFETKLKSLFATGGALAHIKNVSDYEKVVACMDYIHNNVKGFTSLEGVHHSAYYALCEGGGTCQAQATLLYRMLREVGIANRILLGQDAGAHTYNLVWLDGKYYYCDASGYVVLKGSNNFQAATLQERFLTERFQNEIMSKVSTTDYVATTPSTPNTPSVPSNPSVPGGTVKTGWNQVNGNWYYVNSDGSVKTGWLNDGGTWYYMDANGVMQTGWVKDGGTWYYMKSSGAMATGWVKDGSTWYYMKSSGAMATGWVKDGSTWYYMKSSGAMATGWVKDGGTWYYMKSSGAMATGWVKDGSTWYYMNGSGAMQTGWVKDGGKWYYMYASGAMASNTTIGGYRLDASGAWVA